MCFVWIFRQATLTQVFFLGAFLIIAKSDYYVRRVGPSVHIKQLVSH